MVKYNNYGVTLVKEYPEAEKIWGVVNPEQSAGTLVETSSSTQLDNRFRGKIYQMFRAHPGTLHFAFGNMLPEGSDLCLRHSNISDVRLHVPLLAPKKTEDTHEYIDVPCGDNGAIKIERVERPLSDNGSGETLDTTRLRLEAQLAQILGAQFMEFDEALTLAGNEANAPGLIPLYEPLTSGSDL